MTKKDYELIAEPIKKYIENKNIKNNERACFVFFAYDLADKLATTNPKFDREKFLIACGIEKKCKIKIISLFDAMAECECGGWHYRFTGEQTKEEIQKEYKKHLKNKEL